MSSQSNIFFGSDFHFSHANIIRGVSEWKETREEESEQDTRDFATIEEHDSALLKNINDMVKENDIFYFLGDWSFGGPDNVVKFRKLVNCRNIHFIYGNHDERIEKRYSNTDLFSSYQHVLQLTIKIGETETGKHIKQKFFLSHYSHQVWPKSNKGSIHLFGHSHGTIQRAFGKSMDVGVDTNGLRPYHLDEVLDRMKNVDIEIVDHHTSKTN